MNKILLLFLTVFLHLTLLVKAQKQSFNDTTILILNNKYPIKIGTQNYYTLEDFLATDTVKTSNRDLQIISFIGTSLCLGSDIQVNSQNGVLPKSLKDYFVRCNDSRNTVLFHDVKAINKKDETISLGTIRIFIKTKKKKE